MMGAGSPDLKNGVSISTYSFTKNMSGLKTAMYSADGEIIIVPQKGSLRITSEFGKLLIAPKEIIVIPRGVKFLVDLEEEGVHSRGWMAEVYKG